MTLREQLKAALTRAAEIAQAAKTDGRDFTDDEVKEITDLKAKVTDLTAKVEAADAAQAAADEMAGKAAAGDGKPAPKLTGVKDRQEVSDLATFGEQYVKSEAYTAWRKSAGTGFGNGTPISIPSVQAGSLKAFVRGVREGRRAMKADPAPLQVGLGHVQNIRLPTVDLTVPPQLTLLDLIDTSGHIDGPSFEYLQITSVTRGAAIVPDEILPGDTTVKPLSTLGTNLATAKVYTYADGYTVTNQMLADAGGLATYLNANLGTNINSVVEDMILNGTGADGEPTGIMHTTGVQSQAFDTDMVATLRKAITKLAKIKSPITAVAVSAEDDEAFDLMKDADGRYLGQGPWSSGPGTIWGRPRVVSDVIPQGTAILGNWSTVSLMDREGLSVLAFNQHADYARRNLTYVRGELRAAQAIWKPAQLCVADLAA
ncbi:phage major capsid protein [Actinacidiphila epipremni]|uniref:Phage major capsid protein n=1 Tax=Actinacidiphila epipremni TaxID=2053013 RepID=A0ABX0ZHJ9_9ACTN|nr:phage major capsid protein [Actinacidiphila epipremni]NJP42277.1 phage major capsid protein [Actinacidiphila epipremni]